MFRTALIAAALLLSASTMTNAQTVADRVDINGMQL